MNVKILGAIKVRKALIGMLMFAFVGCQSKAQTIDYINITHVITADLLGTGGKDTIFIKVEAKNWSAPITWRLYVKSNRDTIYCYVSKDSLIDRFFNDTGYVGGCNNYISCKKRYYLETIKNEILNDFTCANDPNRICNKSIYSVTKKFYTDSMRLSQEDVKQSIISLREQLLKPSIILNIPKSPVENLKEVVFDKKNKKFVPIHEE
jgi:hypothetical protein